MSTAELYLLSEMAAVDKIHSKICRLRKGVSFVFCPRSRSRMQWDIIKLQAELRKAQRSYVENCEKYVTDSELAEFLRRQDLHDTRTEP